MSQPIDPGATFCDRVTRRSLLRAGALSLGGLSLADVLRGRAAARNNAGPSRQTSVIFIELAGGPSHFETYDPKPEAPQEFRGPLEIIQTCVPGVCFSQFMPRQAEIADRLTVVRSIHHGKNSHDPSSHLTQTGYYKAGAKGSGNEMPCIGAVAARFRGANHKAMPAYVAVPRVMRNGGAAQLGRAFEPFETVDDPNRDRFEVQNLSLLRGLTSERLEDRSTLLAELDRQRRIVDLHGSSEATDQFTRQALDLVTGARAREAFDIGTELESLRETYGRNTVGQSLLLARRLVEAGVTCVTVRVTGWDNHANIADAIEKCAPNYDQGIAALIRDLADRGLARDVLVVSIGEFGRTPRVNKNAGRDHWGAVMSAMLAGGGLKPGIVGASNANGEVPASAPYRPENVLAMVYRHLGIDPAQTFIDLSGRPRYLLEDREIIGEIV